MTTITQAQINDELNIKNLLKEADLPYQDITKHLEHFWVAKDADAIVGSVGLEMLGQCGLLRSLVVAPSYRGQGIGHQLYRHISVYAAEQGVAELCLLTTTAEMFFAQLGFRKVCREEMPLPVQTTEEFSSLCPVSAVCMVMQLTV